MLRVLLDENNDLPPGGPVLVDGIDSVATGMRAEFSTQAGEWPYDFTFGLQWRGAILQKFFDPAATRSLIAAKANTFLPEIDAVSGAQVDIDTTTFAAERQVVITLSDVRVNGEQIDISFTAAI
jgi:hypothetical protein